jgi:hypothetical protein
MEAYIRSLQLAGYRDATVWQRLNQTRRLLGGATLCHLTSLLFQDAKMLTSCSISCFASKQMGTSLF